MLTSMKESGRNGMRIGRMTLTFFLCLLLWAIPSFAQADNGTASIADFFQFVKNQDGEYSAVAILARSSEKGLRVYSGNTGEGESFTLYIHNIDQEYPLRLEEDLGGFKIWTVTGVDESRTDLGILRASPPKKGERAAVVYIKMDSEGNLSNYAELQTIPDVQKVYPDGSALLALDSSIEDVALLPGFVLNEDADCIGILAEKGRSCGKYLS